VQMPAAYKDGEYAFVLTADTLTQYASGIIAGKPGNKQQAIEQIKAAREGLITTGTAFCLEKKQWQVSSAGDGGEWHCVQQVVQYVSAHYQFNVPDNWIDRYFELSRGYQGLELLLSKAMVLCF